MDTANEMSALTRVAWMHYVQRQTHEEIAKRLHVSRPTITRMLTKARDMGIVEIKVHGAYRSCMETGEKINSIAKIKEVLVVPSAEDANKTRDGVGRAAAEYLQDHLNGGDVLGLSWGRTLNAIVPYLKPARNAPLTTVQLMGGLNTGGAINPQQIMASITGALRAGGVTNSVPAVVENKAIKDALMLERSVRGVHEKAKEATVALLGIGDMSDVSSLKQTGALHDEEYARLKRAGAVGDVLAWFYNLSGERADTSFDECVMSVNEAVVKKVPLKVAVTSGLNKRDAVIGALRGGWIDVLIVDEDLAQGIYTKLKEIL